MRALVTGATGFTGGHLARTLARNGVTVRALVRCSSSYGTLRSLGIECIVGDLVSPDDVERAVSGVDVIYHIAAAYREAKHADAYYHSINVIGTKYILDAALKYHVRRVIHCSTVGVHGHIENPPANENAPLRPGDVYQNTKLEAEKLALRYFREGLPGVVFRPVGIYGPGDTRFLKLFQSISKNRFVMFGHGRVYYHLTYIDDLIEGIILCGTKDSALGQVYIIGGEKYVTLNELVACVARAVGTVPRRWHLPLGLLMGAARFSESVCKPLHIEPPLYRRRAEFFKKDRAFDISKAKRELGYCPLVDLVTGLQKTAEWYVDNGMIEVGENLLHERIGKL